MMKGLGSTLIFLHIPKAAGSTLWRIIRRQYAPETILDIHSRKFRESCRKMNALESARFRYNYVKSLSESERKNIKVVTGHDGFGLHELFSQATTYITMLRHPVDRVLSYYYYVLRHKENYIHQQVVSEKMSLEQFVQSNLSPELDNIQTKFIAGLETPYLYENEYTDEILVQAKQNIGEHFLVIGLTERFDESLLLYKKYLGWRLPYYTKANVTKSRPTMTSVSSQVLEIIRQKNALDIALYELVEKQFTEKINSYDGNFPRDLNIFTKINKSYILFQRSVMYGKRKLRTFT